jgi:hypothetical protein
MKYIMQEGTLVLPERTEDRTVNIFQVSGAGDGESCNIVVNRDACEPDESIEAYVGRQMKMLGRTLRSMKETARRETTIGATKMPGMEIEVRSTDVSTGRVQYQIQASCKLTDKSVLLFTLTSPSPLSDALRKDWQQIISSFLPMTRLSENPAKDARASSGEA